MTPKTTNFQNLQHKLEMTSGHYYKILDENVPENILNLLDDKLNEIKNDPWAIWKDNTIKGPVDVDYKYKQYKLMDDNNNWKYDLHILQEYLLRYINTIIDFRISITTGQTLVDWHQLHETPALHLPLQAQHTVFEVATSEKTSIKVPVKRGKLYIFNVCFPHRVFNNSLTDRTQAFCGFTQLADMR